MVGVKETLVIESLPSPKIGQLLTLISSIHSNIIPPLASPREYVALRWAPPARSRVVERLLVSLIAAFLGPPRCKTARQTKTTQVHLHIPLIVSLSELILAYGGHRLEFSG